MKSKKLRLRIAGGLCLFVCLGHTAGTFMPIPPEQTEVAKTVAVMDKTMVPMPIGSAKSYGQLFLGNNLAVSLFMLLLGIAFITIAGSEPSELSRKLLFILSGAALGFAVISAIYFFPLPAVCTGIASLLAFLARR